MSPCRTSPSAESKIKESLTNLKYPSVLMDQY